jgi:DNA-binding response OmpR family regulator
VDVHIHRLRAKLTELAGFNLIRTVRGIGYSFRGGGEDA